MEYDDFLSYWTRIERTQLFDQSWVMSAHWLDVNCRPFPGAWQYGDVSCELISPFPFVIGSNKIE